MPSLIPNSLPIEPKTRRLAERILTRQARIVVLGQGFVGVPEAIDLVEAGFSVIGVDVDPGRVAALNDGRSPVPDVPSERLIEAVRRKQYRATTDASVLSSADVAIICAPTPLDDHRRADLTAVSAMATMISRHLEQEVLVVLESTVPPGATRSVVLPILEADQRCAGTDFFLGLAPERIDPGNHTIKRADVPRLVSGLTDSCRRLTEILYRQVVQTVYPVATPEVAELAKSVENSFRFINISFVNEVARLCDRLGCSVWEVIDAAASKPYAFLPHYPGPGVGGSCIPVVPHYLQQVAQDLGVRTDLIEAAVRTNDDMPRFVVRKLARILAERGIELAHGRILVVGVSYKPNLADVRETPARAILEGLLAAGVHVEYHDPLVPRFVVEGAIMDSVDLESTMLARIDCVVLLTLHQQIDRDLLLAQARLIFDTRNALNASDRTNVVVL